MSTTHQGLSAPVSYLQGLFDESDTFYLFRTLWNETAWVDVAGPRREYYCHDQGRSYTFCRGVGMRTYEAQLYRPALPTDATRFNTVVAGQRVRWYPTKGQRDLAHRRFAELAWSTCRPCIGLELPTAAAEAFHQPDLEGPDAILSSAPEACGYSQINLRVGFAP